MSTHEGTPIIPSEVERTKGKKKIVIVEHAGALETEARDTAEARMTASKKELKGARGFFKKIWKHNLFQEYYRQKEIAVAREEIFGTKNLFAGETEGREAHDAAMGVLVDRFSQEYEEAVHTEAGESRKVLGAEGEDKIAREEIRKALKDYASGVLTDETFEEERVRILSKLTGLSREAVQSEVRHTDSLREVARELRESVEHGTKLEELDVDFDIVVGRAKRGVRTEAQFNTVDRLVEKIQSSYIGCFVNETTLASAVALAYSVTAGLFQCVARSKAFAWGSFGLTAAISGGIAAARESKRIEEERRQHGREMAKSKTFEEAQAPRRKEMETYRYETREARVLTKELSEVFEQNLKEVETFSQAIAKLSDIEARVKLSDRHNIDLISYSNGDMVEQERLDLDVARAQAKVRLRQMHASGEISLAEGETMEGFLTKSADLQMETLTKGDAGIEEKNRAFRKMKMKRVAGAALKGLGTGLVIGGLFQEAAAFFSDEHKGIIEGVIGAPREVGEPVTALERLRMFMVGDTFENPPVNIVEMRAPDGSLLKLPEDVEIVSHVGEKNVFDLVRDGKIIVKGVECENGMLSAASTQAIKDVGGSVALDVHQVIKMVAGEQTAVEAAQTRTDLFHKIHRTLWYGNDTPKPIFDKNELRLDWGGGGDGVDGKGNFVFNISRMRADGSYQGDFSIDAREAMKEGKLKMLLSLTRDTQTQTVEMPIDIHGNAIIDPNSEVGKMFFSAKDGKAVFHGAFAEVAQTTGVGQDGGENVRILATHIGDESVVREVIPTLVQETKVIPISDISLPPGGDFFVVPPPVIPVFGRKPLEKTINKKISDITRGYYYGIESGGLGLLPREEYRRRMMPQLEKNKDVDLASDDSDLTKTYFAKQDQGYVEELGKIISLAPPFDEQTEVVVTVPAYLEGKNLEKTIRNYAKMKGRGMFEIVIFENHPKGKERDNTQEVVKKMRREFPDMKIVHLYKEFDEKPEIGRVRKYLVDAIMLRKQKAGMKKSVAIVSNDADLENISENYALDIGRAFQNNPKLDALAAKWDYPPETFRQLPLLHASQRLWHYFDIALRYNYLKSPELIGRNSAFRSGAYVGVGGYNEHAKVAEDLEIGWLIKDARAYDASRITYLNRAWLVSNPRRAVVKLLSGTPLTQQYGDFHVNENVRKTSLDELLKEKRDLTETELQREVQALYDFYFKMTKAKGGWLPTEYFTKSFERAMRFLGVEYEMKGERVMIKSTDKLRKGLEKYGRK